jgi:tetratricopeptide (TPR) repeat protein
VLDDRTYARFLQYPFINRKTTRGDALLERPTFHDLTRRVRLEGLRRLHPDTWQQLHRVMADHYQVLLEAEQQPNPLPQAELSKQSYAEWFAEIPAQLFRAQLEWLYHALQVKGIQAEAFEQWDDLTGQAVTRWRRKQAGPLLELAQQLSDEEEPFLHKQSEHYGQYLVWYSKFLEQDARWDDARIVLQEASQVFEQGEHLTLQATCFNNIGNVYDSQGQLEMALDYFQRALTLFEQVGDPADIALSLHNIGSIYDSQGQLETGLDYLQRALALFEQVGNPTNIALCCHNIASLRLNQERWQDATLFFLRALSLYESLGRGFESNVANELEELAYCFKHLGESEKEMTYAMRAKQIRELLQKSE